jgi:carbamate kinase
MGQGKLIVVALGGNAISQPHEEGNVTQQFAHSSETAVQLAEIVIQGHQLVITHGNGPQIGNFLLRNDAAAHLIYPLPMEVAVAHVQGGMGYMIAQTLMNELRRRGVERVVTTVITTVIVDGDDPSFANPTKPIGRFLPHEDARRYADAQGWSVREVEPGRFRRVVASPRPRRFLEMEHIRRDVKAGDLLVVGGGGGIPVVQGADGTCRGVRAVVDKDLAAGLLASELGADRLLILTNVDRVFLDYGTPRQRPIDSMTVDDARRWIAEGQFASGSMGPKIEGALTFLAAQRAPDACAMIGPLERAADVLGDRIGTRITRGA